LRQGQVSQADAFAQYQADASVKAAEAANERRGLQQSLLNVQGDVTQLDENTRRQFDAFGEDVNQLFSNVDVDINALQAGQISQAEAQQAFESSVAGQFGQIGGQIGGLMSDVAGLGTQIGGIGEGLAGLGQGVAGLGVGLLGGLTGLGQQQQQIITQLSKPEVIEFDPFLKGLSPRKMPTPLKIQGMLV